MFQSIACFCTYKALAHECYCFMQADLLLQLCQSDNVTGDDCQYFMSLQDYLYKKDNGISQDLIKQTKTQLLR